jgi:hypothetical protein
MKNPEKLAIIKRLESYLDNGITAGDHVDLRNLIFDVNIFLDKENIDVESLKLHESLAVQSIGKDAPTYWQVMRVEAGWIYSRWDEEKQDYHPDSIMVRKG